MSDGAENSKTIALSLFVGRHTMQQSTTQVELGLGLYYSITAFAGYYKEKQGQLSIGKMCVGCQKLSRVSILSGK
jgi:hypothetical protein